MIEFQPDESGESGRLTLRGDVTIQQAESLKEALLESISVSQRLELDMEKIERIDLSGLQLLCSAHRTLLSTGKDIQVIGAVPDVFRQTILEAGFIGCTNKDDKSGIWTGA